VNREAERQAPTGVGSGDLLGFKVIKLNKIKGTQTFGVPICLPLETGASLFSKLETSGYRLKPKTFKPFVATPATY
jgi:hypothetical protein